MITLNLIQGSEEWLAARAKYFTASEAPAMLGLSKYLSRRELLRQKATGITPEVDEATQMRFDSGHASEKATRAWAETFIGEDLYPVTGTAEVDGLPLLASFDGLTLDESIVWENKLWNADYAAQVRYGIVPDTHWPQLEHQLLVSGASRVLFTVSDGVENIVSTWYESDPNRRALVIAGWDQFDSDVIDYQHVEDKPEATGRAPETLPALFVQVEGKVVASNLPAFRAAAAVFLGRLPKVLETDQDFADGEKAVKACAEAEDRLKTVKAQAQAQAVTIDEVFRAIDAISEEIRAARLSLDRRVKAEKENRKAEIVLTARKAVESHIAGLNKRIGGAWLPSTSGAPFAEAIKGLKSLDAMRDKIGAALANAKIEASAIADRIQANKESAADCMHLFPDFGQVCTSPDFRHIVASRKSEAERREAERMEAERARIRAEEQAKAQAEADRIRAEERAKMQAKQDARDAETARQRLLEQGRRTNLLEANALAAEAVVVVAAPAQYPDVIAAEVADTGATMKLGEICDRLGFNLTSQFVAGIGFVPVATDKNAKLFRASDFQRICAALVQHIQKCAFTQG